MSPNPNAQQEELPFRKHQLIKVYGEADEDGFYYAEILKRFGLVPSNMLIEIAQEEIVEERRRAVFPPGGEGVAQDPVIRRMKWGSIKSRSYDNPDQRRAHRGGRHPLPVPTSRYHRHSFAEPSTSAVEPDDMPPLRVDASLERRERSLPATARQHYGERRQADERAVDDGPPLTTRSAYEYTRTGSERDLELRGENPERAHRRMVESGEYGRPSPPRQPGDPYASRRENQHGKYPGTKRQDSREREMPLPQQTVRNHECDNDYQRMAPTSGTNQTINRQLQGRLSLRLIALSFWRSR